MLTKNVDTITDILLSKEIAKYKNAVAFQRFLSHQTENAKTNFNEIINETSNKQSVGCLKNTNTISANKATFKTNIEDSNDITTKEYATVPYPYLQSETTIKPDGTKIHTIYYPSNDEIPAKRIVYSAQSTVKKITLYDTTGNIKSEERTMKFPDGSGVEEKIDVAHQRKTKRYFNTNNVATGIESYVNDQLIFKLECDKNGEIKRESNFYNIRGKQILSKEIIHYKDIGYTVREYTPTGELYSSYTKSIKKK